MSSVPDLKSFGDFFVWCAGQGLTGNQEISAAFGRTPQTVRNWRCKRTRSRLGVPPRHLGLACAGYAEARRQTGQVAPLPEVALAWFDSWRVNHGLATLEATGVAFGLTRQAIHNWSKRGRLPRWLPLACLGYETEKSAAAESTSPAVVDSLT